MGDHRRFFIAPELIDGDTVKLDDATARQITKVLRLREGDRICLLDGRGNLHDSQLSSTARNDTTAKILSSSLCQNEPVLDFTLAICLPKGDKLELIVQKCVELGISRIVVVESERTVSHLDDARASDKMTRWRRIAAEAAEQSGRGIIPEMSGIIDFADLAAIISETDLAIVAWEEEHQSTLKQILRAQPDAKSALLIIGPEGGLSESEVELVKSAGAKSVSLGRRVLRSETAAIAACAVVMYELEGEL